MPENKVLSIAVTGNNVSLKFDLTFLNWIIIKYFYVYEVIVCHFFGCKNCILKTISNLYYQKSLFLAKKDEKICHRLIDIGCGAHFS